VIETCLQCIGSVENAGQDSDGPDNGGPNNDGLDSDERLLPAASSPTWVFQLLQWVTELHCVSKNVPPLTCYKLDIPDPITIIFGRRIFNQESRKSDDALFSHLTYLVLLHYLAKQEIQKLRLFI